MCALYKKLLSGKRKVQEASEVETQAQAGLRRGKKKGGGVVV